MIYLKEANFEDIEKEWQYIAAMPEDENGLTNQWPNISRVDFEKTALPEIINHSKGIDMPDEVERLKTASAVFLTPSNRTRATSGSAQVAETFLFLWDDDTIVGLFRLRQYLNDALREGSIYIENATKILSVFCLTHLLYIISVMESVKRIVEKDMPQKVWH